MEIVLVTPEVVPYSKVGGLGDVSGALPKALRALGHKVTVLSLRYGSVDPAAHSLARRLTRIKVPLAGKVVDAELWEARLPSGVNVCLLGGPGVSDRAGVYGEGGKEYADNHLRFGLLCRGAIEWMRAQPRLPDVVHAHDWPASLVPTMLKHLAKETPALGHVKTVLTIHNLAHQGLFAPETLAELGLPASEASPDRMEFWGAVSWLKGGIIDSDRVTTVSPGYAKEVLTPAGGARMDGVLRASARGFTGILNGVDPGVWNPSTDPHVIARYDAEDPLPKARCKTDLQQRLGLPVRPETPVLAMVSRIDAQKGIDLLAGAAHTLLRQDVQLVVQGQGDPALMDVLAAIAREAPEKMVFRTEYDDALAHRIFAGADLFLAPARFEPCGLTQLYAMRYGAIPVVRATGGLRDTVIDCDVTLASGTGFVFEEASPEALYGAVSRGLAAYADGGSFAKLRRRVMRQDWSWDRAAHRYQAVFEALVPAETRAAAP